MVYSFNMKCFFFQSIMIFLLLPQPGQDGHQAASTHTGSWGYTLHHDESSADDNALPGGAHVNQNFLGNV